MKKKTLSLALALVMCLGLTVPASALKVIANGAGGGNRENNRTFTISADAKSGTVSELGAKSVRVQNWNFNKDEATGLFTATKTAVETLPLSQVTELTPGSEIIIETSDGIVPDADFARCQAWSDPDGDGVYESRILKVELFEGAEEIDADTDMLDPGVAGPFTETLEENASGSKSVYYSAIWPMSCTGKIYYFTLGYGGGLEGEPARISTDYLIKEFGTNTLFCLKFEKSLDPQTDQYTYDDYYFLLSDEKPTTPDKPDDTQTDTPVIEVENIPASGTALASTQTVTVDGKAVEFQMYALADANGNLTNYIKLRDMAYVLNGTKAQFSVGYDGIISLTKGQPYEAGGTEMTTPFSGDRAYTGGAQTLKIDGKDVAMTAITLTDDNGGGYNYFKLRDLGKALGFNVSWDNGVIVESGKPYVG